MSSGRRDPMTLLRGLPCLVYLLILGWFSLQPQQTMPAEISDKLLHLAAYAGAALLWGWAAWSRPGLWLGLPLLIGYGVGLELAQALTPDRYPSADDAFANALGVVIGTGLFLLLQKSRVLRQLLHLPAMHSG